MFDKAIEVLKTIEKNGYKAYIVGGYVRDIYLSIKSTDIDICTNATPKELVKIFKKNIKIDDNYGSVKLGYKNTYFDITTFRKDIIYKDNRRPSEIEYVDSLEEDLLRRDFTINTMCMDSNGNIIDILNAKKDIQDKVIKTVGDSKRKISEDSLRILRAIRFATTLDFRIDKKLEKAIKKYIKTVSNLSFNRKKDELNLIFKSDNYVNGFNLIKHFKLDKYLEISNITNIKKTTNLLGMWAQMNYSDNYPFSNLEKDTIKKVRELLIYGKIDVFALYKYENIITMIVAEILDLDKKELLKEYDSLPIHNEKDIKIDVVRISKLLNKKPCEEMKTILSDIEYKILNKELENKKSILEKYVIGRYGDKNEG